MASVEPHCARKEEFLRVHIPELLTAEGKKYYAYLDFPDKQVDLLTFWQRSVQKVFFFLARSAVLSYQRLFDALSVDGFQPFILPMVVFELAQKGELGAVLGEGLARVLLEKNSLPRAKRHLQELAREGELDAATPLVCYEYLESKLRVAEGRLGELFRARPFLREAQVLQAVREAAGADEAECEILRVLLLVATPVRVHEEHYFNSAAFAGEEEVSRQFMLFELENAVAEGEAALAQPARLFSKGNISAILGGDERASRGELPGGGEAAEPTRRQLAYNRLMHEFVSAHKDWEEIVEFGRNVDYVKLKASSFSTPPGSSAEQKLVA